MSKYLIKDLWNMKVASRLSQELPAELEVHIVLNYLDGDIKACPEFFEKNIDKLNWLYISMNRSIPIEFFEKNLDKLSWPYISYNKSIPI